jgi:hypothetical protein
VVLKPRTPGNQWHNDEPHGCVDRSAHALSSTRGEKGIGASETRSDGWESGVRLFGGECKRPERAIARRSELGGVAAQGVRMHERN